MAEPLLHTDKDPQYSKSAFSCESFSLPSSAHSASPTNTPRKANADLGTDCAKSVLPGVFFEVPNPPSTADRASFAHSGALFEVASAQSSAGLMSFALPHVDLNAQARANCAGFAHPDALSVEDPHAQLSADCSQLDALFEAPKAQPITTSSWFAHLHATSADQSAPVIADCTDFVHPEALFEGPYTHARENCAGSAYPQENCRGEHVQLSAAYAHKCEESTNLHEEFADSTEACGNDGNYMCVQVGSADVCESNGGVSCRELSRGTIAKTHGGIHDTCAYPCVEVAEYRLPLLSSDPQPCVSECSSTTSMLTISESTSRSNDANMDTKFTETHWTDAKHRSYLTLMEANFVKVLYSREYCALDVCGQAPCHPGSSSPPLPSSLLKFKSGQSGDWWMPEPPFPACIPSALLKGLWVNHFRHRNSANACHQIKDENTRTSIDMCEGEEEVDSPSTFISHAEEPQKGLQEKRMLKDGSNGSMVVGESKEDVMQEFAHATMHLTSFPNLKKRGFQPDCEQKPHKFSKIKENRLPTRL